MRLRTIKEWNLWKSAIKKRRETTEHASPAPTREIFPGAEATPALGFVAGQVEQRLA
jgi:hypothetical protein